MSDFKNNYSKISLSLLEESTGVEFQGVKSMLLEMLQAFSQYAPKCSIDMSKKFPHKKAEFVYGKRSYIKFGIWDEKAQSIKIKKWYRGFSKLKTKKEQEEYAQFHIDKINKLLPTSSINGEEPKENPIEIKELRTITEACQYMLDLKYTKEGIDSKSALTMRSTTKKFLEWIDKKGMKYTQLNQLKKYHVQDYIDYMVNVEGLAPKTVHNRYTSTRALFSKMVRRNLLKENPFKGDFDKPKVEATKRNFAYSDEQIQDLKNWFLENNPNMWVVCQFIYYTYVRPIEVRRIKVKHILWDKNQIYIPASISKKNKKDSFLMLPAALKKALKEWDLKSCDPESYLFTTKWKPGKEMIGYNFFAKEHKKAVVDLGYSSEYTLYSWKHTGVVNAYKSGVDIKAIQLQCRHSSIAQTDQYLKSLGFVENDSFSKGIPEI